MTEMLGRTIVSSMFDDALDVLYLLPAYAHWPDPEEWHQILDDLIRDLARSLPHGQISIRCRCAAEEIRKADPPESVVLPPEVCLKMEIVQISKGHIQRIWLGRCPACGRVYWVGNDCRTSPPNKSSRNPEDIGITFGKYRGKTLGWLAENDLSYLDWMRDADCCKRDVLLQRAVESMYRKYTSEIEKRLGEEDG